MSRPCFPRVSALLPALAAIVLLGGCAATPRAGGPAATSGDWLAMTSGELPGAFLLEPGVATAPAPAATAAADDDEDEGHGFIHGVLLYIPNRIFDVLDIVRLRVRVGPGFGVGVRATELADLYLGAYTSVFVGIPGPRGEPEINWPFGIETNVGAEASVADASTGGGTGPGYGPFEFGLGLHVLLVGLDIGIEPWEAVDFVTGILTIDPVGDDL